MQQGVWDKKDLSLYVYRNTSMHSREGEKGNPNYRHASCIAWTDKSNDAH